MSRVFLLFAAAFVALMVGALLYAARMPATVSAPQAADVPPSPPAVVDFPAFAMPDIDGTERQLSDWQGKHRILNFWATWCGPCKREIPLLKAFQTAQAGNGFQVIGIAVDFPEEVSYYAEAAEFNYPILVGQQDAMAVAESSGIEFAGLPFTMFIAPDGEYLNAFLGELHQPQLDRIVEVMLQMEQGAISRDEAKAALGDI